MKTNLKPLIAAKSIKLLATTALCIFSFGQVNHAFASRTASKENTKSEPLCKTAKECADVYANSVQVVLEMESRKRQSQRLSAQLMADSKVDLKKYSLELSIDEKPLTMTFMKAVKLCDKKGLRLPSITEIINFAAKNGAEKLAQPKGSGLDDMLSRHDIQDSYLFPLLSFTTDFGPKYYYYKSSYSSPIGEDLVIWSASQSPESVLSGTETVTSLTHYLHGFNLMSGEIVNVNFYSNATMLSENSDGAERFSVICVE